MRSILVISLASMALAQGSSPTILGTLSDSFGASTMPALVTTLPSAANSTMVPSASNSTSATSGLNGTGVASNGSQPTTSPSAGTTGAGNLIYPAAGSGLGVAGVMFAMLL